MIEAQLIKKSISDVLVGAGFRKVKPNTWQWRGPEVTIGIGLDKDPIGDVYYLNVGFWIDEIRMTDSVQIHHSHMYYRVQRLVPELVDHTRTALVRSVGTEEHLLALCEAIRGSLVPYLMQ